MNDQEIENILAYFEREDIELNDSQLQELQESGTIGGRNYLDWMFE